MLINKFTTGFSEEKVPKTQVVLKMAIQLRKKNGVHDFTCTTSLICVKQYIIAKEFYSKQRNQSSDFYFIENIPKTSKNAAHVLQWEFFLKAPP